MHFMLNETPIRSYITKSTNQPHPLTQLVIKYTISMSNSATRIFPTSTTRNKYQQCMHVFDRNRKNEWGFTNTNQACALMFHFRSA